MSEYFVYEISCSKDDRVYVGMSPNPGTRFRVHMSSSKSEDFPLYKAIREYGKDAFSWRPITKHETRAEALAAEKGTIHAYRRAGRSLFNGNLILPEDRKSRPDNRTHITIRPRVNSDLERIHEERRKEFPDLIHDWATAFAENVKQSEQGESEQ